MARAGASGAPMAARSPMVQAIAVDAKPSDVSDNLLADGDIGGYNTDWMDPGRSWRW